MIKFNHKDVNQKIKKILLTNKIQNSLIKKDILKNKINLLKETFQSHTTKVKKIVLAKKSKIAILSKI